MGISPPVNQIVRHEKRPDSPVFFRASGGYSCIGGYRVFLVATEGFVYQVVELNHQCIQIMSGKCDQMRPSFPERDQMRPNNLLSLIGPQFCGINLMRYIYLLVP
jgi:hypothetical protein